MYRLSRIEPFAQRPSTVSKEALQAGHACRYVHTSDSLKPLTTQRHIFWPRGDHGRFID